MSTNQEIDWREGVIPTTYGTGPFHPAIRNGRTIFYWPNITKATEDEAYNLAMLSLADMLQPSADCFAQWNVYKV